MTPGPDQRAVIEHDVGRLKVLAGPGTGKTAAIVESVADRILRRGVDPRSILVLTFSRRAAAELSRRIAARLAITVTDPVVRTLHSYAYAIVRAAAVDAGDPAPRLLEAGQADVMVREMLAGHADDGGRYWPAELHAALRVRAFAAELRELALRLAERQISSRRVAALGRRMNRPAWVAVAAFLDEYRDIGQLRQGTARLGAAFDQAELVAAALDRLADPAVLSAQQARFRRIFVDEYQDVDPAQARLIEMLAGAADEFVAVGDPDQAIYAFRGAAAGAMEHMSADSEVVLAQCYRMSPAVLHATRRVAQRLSGRDAHRRLTAAGRSAPGAVDVRVLHSAAQEGAYIADRLRRAHAESAISWSQMAILLRSPTATGPVIRRALAAAGVPAAAGPAGPLAAEPLVAAFLTVLRAAAEPRSLTVAAAMALLASPLGGFDPLMLRRLRRGIRALWAGAESPVAAGHGVSSGALIVDVLAGRRALPDDFAADLATPLRRVAGLTALARAGAHEPSAEAVLWRLWEASGLADRLRATSERGGRDGARADDHLDAVIALFDRAAALAAQLPSAGVRGLLDLLDDEEISGPAARDADVDAVSILSAHAAKGLEWSVVAVAGVQDDTWPDLRPRSSLLGLRELLDAAAGIDPALPAASTLDDERRLFYVAATRAREQLIVTAVDDEENTPSRFVGEIAGRDAIGAGWPTDAHGEPARALHLPAVVADLRRAVCSGGEPTADGAPPADGARRADGAGRIHRAAVALARLAAAGVSAADPATWHGLAPVSSDAPLVAPAAEIRLSPSQVESLQQCPLRTVLERNGGRTEQTQPQLLGIAVHALAEGLAAGASDVEVDRGIDEFLRSQDHLAPWEVARLRRRMRAMRDALTSWMTDRARDRSFVGSECVIDIALPSDGGPPIRLTGRIDWLSADEQQRLVVTDFKTGSSPPSKAEVRGHSQLAVYQLAVALGALGADVGASADGSAPTLGGAELVYLSTGRPVVRAQPAQTADERHHWLGELRRVGESAAGSSFVARPGEYCSRCPVRASCPVQPEGRQVPR